MNRNNTNFNAIEIQQSAYKTACDKFCDVDLTCWGSQQKYPVLELPCKQLFLQSHCHPILVSAARQSKKFRAIRFRCPTLKSGKIQNVNQIAKGKPYNTPKFRAFRSSTLCTYAIRVILLSSHISDCFQKGDNPSILILDYSQRWRASSYC